MSQQKGASRLRLLSGLALRVLGGLACWPEEMLGAMVDGWVAECDCLVFHDSGSERALGGTYEASVCVSKTRNARQIVEEECEGVYSTNDTIGENHTCECECITLETRCYSEHSTLTDG